MYELNNQNILRLVEDNRMGNYSFRVISLECNDFRTKYVGRSLHGLPTRIRRGLKKYYTHFHFEYADSPFEAFAVECREWHIFQPNLDNRKHPEAPPNLPYLCPYCLATPRFSDGDTERRWGI